MCKRQLTSQGAVVQTPQGAVVQTPADISLADTYADQPILPARQIKIIKNATRLSRKYETRNASWGAYREIFPSLQAMLPACKPCYQLVSKPCYQPVRKPCYQPASHVTNLQAMLPACKLAMSPTCHVISLPCYQPASKPCYQPASKPCYQPASHVTSL